MHGVQKEKSVNRRSTETRLPTREFDITFLGAESASRLTRLSRVFAEFTVRNSTFGN